MYIILGFGIVLFVWALLSYASKKPMRDAVRNIPGPYNIPLLGALLSVYGITPENFFAKNEELVSDYGLCTKRWIFNRLLVTSGDAELNEQLLASTKLITKQRMYGILHQWLGGGLLLSDGRKWHSRRKIITPAFHFKILEQFVQIFDQQASILVDCLAERADGRTAFDIHPYICTASLDIIAETAMGTKINAQTDKSLQYTAAVKEMTAHMFWRFVRVHLNSELIFTLLHPQKKLRQMKLIRIMHDFTTSVIEERRKTLESNLLSQAIPGHDTTGDDDIGTKKRSALLDVLLQSTIDGKPLSNEDIREEVDTFMFEGHDTTTSALSFILYLVARHPQVQNKLLAEIRQVYGDDDSRSFGMMNLNELKYMECVIKESLRMYPPVPMIGREVLEDFKCKHSQLGDVVLPAGAELFIVLVQTLWNSKYFQNPFDFIPERHEKAENNAAYTFIPFSAGPRNCIGQKFAMYEMKVILVKLIRAYELLPLGEDVQLVLNIVTRSSTGAQLGIRKRIS